MEATVADNTQMKTVVFDDAIVRAFSVITIVWGVVALLAGVIVAAQLSFWQLNFGVEWLSFGRLRPLHTNAVIFAFGGSALTDTSIDVPVDGVVEAPNGAHFTECPPDYGRDEAFQREYAATAKYEQAWQAFKARYLDVASEQAYQQAVSRR